MYWNSYMALPMRKIFDTGSVIIINKTILLFDLEYFANSIFVRLHNKAIHPSFSISWLDYLLISRFI
jgi:hypothetical protein